MKIKEYVDYRNTLEADFWEKYKGLNIGGKDYRQYIFNYFERAKKIYYLPTPIPRE